MWDGGTGAGSIKHVLSAATIIPSMSRVPASYCYLHFVITNPLHRRWLPRGSAAGCTSIM